MHAYLIIAHNQFELLERLIRCIDDERNDIYIHIDSKATGFDKEKIIASVHQSAITFTNRIHISWGGFDMVRCEYILLEAAFESGKHYDYIHLISGVDLPLVSQNEMHKFFDEHNGCEFVHFGGPQLREIETARVKYYHFASGRRNYFNRFITKTETVVQRALKVDRLKGLKIQRGSQWFSITGDFAKYVLSQKSFVFRQFKNTYIPDEFFIQTLLINSDFVENLFDKRFNNDHYACVRYIDWNRGHPYTFRESDFDEIMSSGCMFARKFSMDVDSAIVEKITQAVLG